VGEILSLLQTITPHQPPRTPTTSQNRDANKIQGNYTITRPTGCYYPSDNGTFTATKQ